ncbi:MAG: Carnitine transport binding protein OpuCC [Chlamydiia bacterium]|nr:Carnitine transport binding protein OpuCC [Chlamydiia bacterium]MCH9615387.1 Carnitine transport binding protein OpuCC [Chlamydiia bacterium]MCH9628291.1 Carnitine transport binding protein OpuCC [Chlamydiia bacterium]
MFYLASSKRSDIVIGGKNNNEQRIVGEALAILLEHYTDLSIGRKFHIDGTFLVYEALRSNLIDLNVEYEGTARQCLFKDLTCDLDQAFSKLGLKRVHDLGFSNSYVLLVHPLSKLQKLSEISGKMRVGYDAEYRRRVDCFEYGGDPFLMDPALLYLALDRKQLDVINASTTEGLTVKYGLRKLQDDVRQMPSYRSFVVVREKVLKKYPEIKSIIQKLHITTEEMTQLNYQTDCLKRAPKDVAYEFLVEKNMLEC